MYITINDIIGEKRIDLSYPIRSSKEVAVITMFSDNVQYEIIKPHTIVDSTLPAKENLILRKTYAGRELISDSGGMTAFTHFVNEDRIIKTNKLAGITEMIFNLNELDNTNNLEDGKPSNILLTYHVTADKDFTRFEPHIPQYKKLKIGEFVSLSLRIMDQKNNILTNDLQVTVVLHIRDCKL